MERAGATTAGRSLIRRFAGDLARAGLRSADAKVLLPPTLQRAVPYALSVASVAFAVWISLLLKRHGFREPSGLFFFAVASTIIWYRGIGPPIVAFVLSSVSFQYYFVEAVHSFSVALAEVPYYASFLLLSAALVLVSVRDTGKGLDPQNRDWIFEAFYTTKPDGMGMGLSISRSIVQNHGGRLWADSGERPGATFRFTLPKAG